MTETKGSLDHMAFEEGSAQLPMTETFLTEEVKRPMRAKNNELTNKDKMDKASYDAVRATIKPKVEHF